MIAHLGADPLMLGMRPIYVLIWVILHKINHFNPRTIRCDTSFDVFSLTNEDVGFEPTRRITT